MVRVILPWLKNRYLKVRNQHKVLPTGARINLTARDSLNIFQKARCARYVVFDIETTGFDATRDRIVGIGAVRIQNGRIRTGESFNQIVNPKIQMSAESVKVHRIMPQTALSAPPASKVIDAFLEYVGRDILVAHCAGFDVGFLNRYMKQRYGFGLQNMVLDAMPLSRIFLLPDSEQNPTCRIKMLGEGRGGRAQHRCTLDEMARYLGIVIHKRHTGIGDSLATGLIFQRILAKAEKRHMDRLIHLISLGGL